MGCPCFEPMSPGGGVTAPSPPTIPLESEVETEEEGEEMMQQHNTGNNPTVVTSKQVFAGNSNHHQFIDEKTQKVIERLQNCHPNATDAECIRFYRCTKLNEDAASTRLKEWFDWRREHGLMVSIGNDNAAGAKETTTSTSYDDHFKKEDEQLWDEAAKKAIQFISKSSGGGKGGGSDDVKLPQLICSYSVNYGVVQPKSDAAAAAATISTPTVSMVKSIHSGQLPLDSQEEEGNEASLTQSDDNNNGKGGSLSSKKKPTTPPPQCKDGSRIFQLVPARLDLTLASAQVYALASALYLDRRLSRHTTEKISLICDVRGGNGWANPTPWSLLPFIRATSSLLGQHFPERLKRFVLFPMPSSAVWIWSTAKKFVDVDTASKVVVVGLVGASGNANDTVNDELDEFITKKDLGILEERRRSFFA